MSEKRIDAAVMDRPMSGINISGATLRDEIGQTPTLLVFLRHFGCIFCREMVGDLKRIAKQDPDYPPVLFFFQGTNEEGEAFFSKAWPGARAVGDVPKHYYNAFGVGRGGMMQMFGPEVVACGVRAAAKGHLVGWKTGDPWTLPVTVLLHQDRVLWRHEGRHAGDHPDLERVPQRLAAALSTT